MIWGVEATFSYSNNFKFFNLSGIKKIVKAFYIKLI